jgi:hypothetical protein
MKSIKKMGLKEIFLECSAIMYRKEIIDRLKERN